jgi:hypothetical protein
MKRARLECELFSQIGERLIRFLIFPHLNAADCARFGATCKTLHVLAKMERRVRLHYMQYSHPREVFGGMNLSFPAASVWADEGLEQLVEYGYTGEGRMLCYDRDTDRYMVFNDFYARGFESDYWDGLVDKIQKDQEFGFQFKFIEFPTLHSNQRYLVFQPFYTVHRGSCIMVSWPAKIKF